MTMPYITVIGLIELKLKKRERHFSGKAKCKHLVKISNTVKPTFLELNFNKL